MMPGDWYNESQNNNYTFSLSQGAQPMVWFS